MQQAVTDHVIRLIPHVGNAVADAEKERLTEVQEEAEGITGQHGSGRTKSIKLGAGQKVIAGPGVATEKKIGRNDLCFCGSGKKYKKCHGKDEK